MWQPVTNMTIRDKKHDKQWRQTWQSVTQYMTIVIQKWQFVTQNATIRDKNTTICDTRNDNTWHNARQSVTQGMTIRDTRHDNPWHKTWQSVTQDMTIRDTRHDNLWRQTTKLVLPKIYISRNRDMFPSYMNILQYPSIHHMRYFCLSVCLTSSKQLTPSLCVFHIIPLPSFIPTQPLF